MNTPSTIHRDTIAQVAEAVDNALVAAVHVMDGSDGADLDVVLISLAEARAYVVKASIMAIVADRVIDATSDQPRVYADELTVGERAHHAALTGAKPKPLELPKLQPLGDTRKWEKQRPGIAAKLKRPLDYECPTCHAEAGTFCFKFTNQGKNGKITEERNQGTSYHALRSARSRDANHKIKTEYDRNQAKAMKA